MLIKRRWIIRFLSFFVALVTILMLFVIISHNEMLNFRTEIEYDYDMNLNELDGSLYNISVTLRKAMYASTATQFSKIAAELSAESTVAKNALSQLPSAESELSSVNRFLSQVGDFAIYLSKKVISGDEINEDERKNLHSLANVAATLSTKVDEVRAEYEKEGVWTAELSHSIGESVGDGFGSQLLELEEMLSDYPTLIYDGPFSDHILNSESQLLKGKSEVSLETARTVAISAFQGKITEFSEETESGGKLATYDFYFEENYVSVSKVGGYIVNMRKFRVIEDYKISYDDAVGIALDYILKKSGKSFVSTYYFAEEGVCVVNLAYKEGTAVCYPDLIKVGVAMDTGEIMFIEAAGYIANHRIRNMPSPKFSVADATEKLSDALTVETVRRSIIPTDGLMEKHCYEFKCKGIDGEEILVYINVDTLEEEQILLLLKTDGGTLVK